MSLRDAVIAIQAHARTAGALEAPNDPTETNMAFPFSVTYLRTSRITGESSGMEKDLETLNVDVLFNRIDLPTDIMAVLAFYELFKPLLINDPTLGGTVDTIQMADDSPISVEMGEMKYANQDMIGLRWSITVKRKT